MNVTIECRVLEYDELSPKTQERLLQRAWESASECYRADPVEDDFRERLTAIGFMNPSFWWSINGGQGDGACFDAEPDMAKICKHLGIAYDPQTLEDEWTCSVETLRGNAVHAKSRIIECDASPEIQEQIEELRLQLCGELYKALQDEYESETSKETLLENLRSRQYAICDELQKAIAEASQSEEVMII